MVTDGTKDLSLMDSIKIKQEKITPPSTPNINTSATELGISADLLDNILGERKPVAEPIKSSNEILADLFKVFNAAPPTLDDDDTTKDSSTHKKKKHKKEKKVKKEKKRSRSNSECKSSGDEPKSKKRKAKKSKKNDGDANEPETKRHKRHKKSKDSVINNEKIDVVIKKEKIVEEKASTFIENGSDLTSKQDKNPPMQIQVCVTKDNDGIGKRKIVIKSLVDSVVYQDTLKEVDAKQKEKEREKIKHKEREREKDKEKEKDKDRTRDREKLKERAKIRDKHKRSSRSSKSKEKEYRSRGRSNSSSLSLSDEETYLREKEQRERYRDRVRESRDEFYGEYRRDSAKHRSRNDFRHHDDRRRSRSSSRHRRDDERIDKKRLLEIARKNAITMLKNGTLPGAHNLDPEAKEKALTKMRFGGKSVDELTEFCKKLSKGESSGYLSNISGGESDVDADLEKPFHHPFVIKDRGPIVMNIKNSTPIPPKTAEQTKAILMQFPVSSGQHHRANESEWVPVETPKPPKKDKESSETATPEASTTSKHKSTTHSTVSKPTDYVPLPTTDYGYQTCMFLPSTETPPVFGTPAPVPAPVPVPVPTPVAIKPVPAPQPISAPLPPPSAPSPIVIQNPATTISISAQQSSDNIFAGAGMPKDLDVTSIITKRLNAMRKLQDNPMDSEAIKAMYRTQKDMSAWASSKFVPGQFTGSTGANILSTRELASGFQAWAKRDQLIATTPVSGGMGMHLLQKMGWKPGEGLGKEKNGSLQPLLLEVKLDKKGLVAEEESPQVQRQRAQAAKKMKAQAQAYAQSSNTLQQAKQNFESKHPVSLLGELSAKRKFGPPLYELVMQEGPSHQRQFLYSVQINGQSFQPNTTSLNKKEAKANAAKFALQKMGFLPDAPSPPVQSMQLTAPVPPVRQIPPAQSFMAPSVQNAMGFTAPNTFS